MTPALFSVYRPYIMFFALIDKFHQLLKVSETCFSYMCWLHKYNVLSTSADLLLYVQAIATHFIWVNCWQLFNKAIMQLVWRFEIQPLRMHIVSLVSGYLYLTKARLNSLRMRSIPLKTATFGCGNVFSFPRTSLKATSIVSLKTKDNTIAEPWHNDHQPLEQR